MARTAENKILRYGFGTGIHQETSEYAAPPGSLKTATNLRITQRGTLTKRLGPLAYDADTTDDAHPVTADGSGAHIEVPSFMTTVGDVPLYGITSGEAFAYDETEDISHFSGMFSTCVPHRRRSGLVSGIPSTGFGQLPPSIAVNSSGFLMVAALMADDLHVFIENANGARVFYRREDASSYIRARVVAVANVFYLVTQVGTTITAISITPSDAGVTLGTPATVGTLNNSAQYWDLTSFDATHWYMIHQSGSVTLTVNRFAGTTSNANVSLTVTGAPPVSIFGHPDQGLIWIGWYNDPTGAGNVRFAAYNNVLTTLIFSDTLVSGANVYGPPLFGLRRDRTDKAGDVQSVFYCFRYKLASGNETRAIYSGTIDAGSLSFVGATPRWHVLPISKPDNYQRVWCITSNGSDNFQFARIVLLRYHDIAQATSPVVELSLPKMLAAGESHGPDAFPDWFSAIATGDDYSYAIVPFTVDRVIATDDPIIKLDVLEYQTAEQHFSRDDVRLDPGTVLAGLPTEFFGQPTGRVMTGGSLVDAGFTGASEVGFLHAPIITATSTAGGTIPPGTYEYQACFRWIDIYGRVHRSDVSPPVTVTLETTSDVTLSISALSISQRQSGQVANRAKVELYRTVNGGVTHKRLAHEPEAFDNSDGIITIDDTSTDAQIQSNPAIYTDGGVLANDLGPSTRFMSAAEEAVWFGGGWDGQILQRSKLAFPGEPLLCTDDPSHQVILPRRCTGLAYQDGQVVAFMNPGIALVGGEGPNDQGRGAFSPPRMHTHDIGCIDYRSILETDIGIIFQSHRGFELLPRGFGQVEYIGEALRADFASVGNGNPFVGCAFAAVHSKAGAHLARFGAVTDASPYTQTVYTLDLIARQWFKDEFNDALGAMGSWPNGFAMLMSDLSTQIGGATNEPLFYENGNAYADPSRATNQYIPTTMVSNWIYPFDRGGWGKLLKLIFEYEHIGDDVVVTLSLLSDHESAITQSMSWTSTGAQGRRYRQMDVEPPDCTAFRYTIATSISGNNTQAEGIRPLSLTAEIEPSGGVRLTNEQEREV